MGRDNKINGVKKLIIISILLLILSSFIQCEKYEPINNVLYDKPLEVIQKYILGKWKLAYAKGGIAYEKIYCDSCIIEFTSDNRYLFRYNDSPYLINVTINWRRGYSCAVRDSTWLWDYGGISYVIDRIYNDTLIYASEFADGYSYHLVKTK
jgi:hypothetical protein